MDQDSDQESRRSASYGISTAGSNAIGRATGQAADRVNNHASWLAGTRETNDDDEVEGYRTSTQVGVRVGERFSERTTGANRQTTHQTQPSRVPVAVQEAIAAYVPAEGFVLKPPKRLEFSIMFEYGVQAAYTLDGVVELGWICLGNEICRSKMQFIHLSVGKTSRALKHLKEVQFVVSDKTQAENDKIRSRDDKCERLRGSQLFETDPSHLLLMENLIIISNNLSFRIGEHTVNEERGPTVRSRTGF